MNQLIETKYNQPSKLHPNGTFSAKLRSTGSGLDEKARVKIEFSWETSEEFHSLHEQALVDLLVKVGDTGNWSLVGQLKGDVKIWARTTNIQAPIKAVVVEPVLHHKLGIA